MTNNEAYVQGLTASENAVIANFTQLMETGTSLRFQSPQMEALRLKLKDKLESSSPAEVDPAEVALLFERILTNGPTFDLYHSKLNKVSQAYEGFMAYIHKITTDATSPIGKKIEKDLKTAIDFIKQ
jgi:hypothetical protein